MITGYSMLANGGKKIVPTLIDRVQDRYGRTIFRHDERECDRLRRAVLDRPAGAGIHRPARAGHRSATPPIRSPRCWRAWSSAAPARPSRWSASRWPARPAPPMTRRDAWFIGYTPDLAVGVYVGYDKPRPMGSARHRRRARGADRGRLHAASRSATSRRRRSGCRPASSSSRSTAERPARRLWRRPTSSWRRSSRATGPPQVHRSVDRAYGDGSGNRPLRVIEGGSDDRDRRSLVTLRLQLCQPSIAKLDRACAPKSSNSSTRSSRPSPC